MSRREASHPSQLWRIEKIRNEIDAGWSLHMACASAGTPLSTVHRWAKRYPQWQEILDYYSIVHRERTTSVSPSGDRVTKTSFKSTASDTWKERAAFLPMGAVKI